MATFFTSDTHFGHSRIIQLCNRPFHSVEEMDDVMIKNWNMVVHPTDTVMHLGDCSWRNHTGYLSRLNGRKILIMGNHDRKDFKMSHGWDSMHEYLELDHEGCKLILFHYPIWEYNQFFRDNTYHLYGHCHGRSGMVRPKSWDVGVDSNHFTPQLFSDLKKKMLDTMPTV